ncbi:glycosyltransferase family 4 protein [Iodobacter ciconiae]|uniref:Glycosyltransferase family 1 protein n=1 Tax=Iodobacter ciconiae TaxID=2496266 RepID=A0A3S8ZPH1_9NEIS|nr:glycosyltransferase family 1 protein [Iodobacter ciconiae]AZN35364.1 glycosyltransferase family 1 protein [Iodobacter ciconiae]
MKKRILINHLLEPANKLSGISNYLFFLMESIIKRNEFELVLLTCWHRDKLPAEIADSNIVFIEKEYINSQAVNIANQNYILPKIIRDYNIDLVFNCNPVGGTRGKAKKVFVAHDLYFDVSPQSYKWHHRLAWNIFFPLAGKAADAIICVSNNTKNDVQRYHPKLVKKTQVIHEASCLDVIDSHPVRSAEKAGLFVANLSPNKGAKTLVSAMTYLKNKGIHLPVYHVGRDDHSRFAAHANILKNGIYPSSLGYVSAEKLGHLYATARYLAFPSHFEGFGLPIIEAQSYGLPIIASDIPVLREVAGEGALFFPEGDAEAMAQCMQRLYEDEHLFTDISIKARINADRFSWEKAAKETSELFLHCLDHTA